MSCFTKTADKYTNTLIQKGIITPTGNTIDYNNLKVVTGQWNTEFKDDVFLTNNFTIDQEKLEQSLPVTYEYSVNPVLGTEQVVAKVENKIVGKMTSYYRGEKQLETSHWVLPDYQRQGLATNMLLTLSQNTDKEIVSSMRLSDDSIAFYKGLVSKGLAVEIDGRYIITPQGNGLYIKLINFVKAINPNFRIEILQNLPVSAIADISNYLITLKSGEELESLPEEVAHFFIELLPNGSLKSNLLKGVLDTKIYQEVLVKYKNLPEYQVDGKPNYDKLKREAAAQVLAEYLNGNTIDREIDTGVIAWIEKIWKRIKVFLRGQDIDYFEYAANEILNTNTKSLSTESPVDEMFFSYNPTTFQTLKGLDTAEYGLTVINLNHTLFNTAKYHLPSAKIFFTDDATYNTYVNTIGLTALGQELKDKIEAKELSSSRIIIATASRVTPELKARLKAEFGNVRVIHTPSDTVVEDENGNLMLVPQDIKTEITSIVNRNPDIKVLYVDNRRLESEPTFDIIRYNIRVPYIKPHITANPLNITEEAIKELSLLDKEISDKYISEAHKKITNTIKRMNDDELSAIFKDEGGDIRLPEAYSRAANDLIGNMNKDERRYLNWIHTLRGVGIFFLNANKNKYEQIENFIQTGQLGKAIKELNYIQGLIEEWNSYFSSLQSELAGLQNQHIRKLIQDTVSEITQAHNLVTKLSQTALADKLLPLFDEYNAKVESETTRLVTYYDTLLQANPTDSFALEERAKLLLKNSLVDRDRISSLIRGEVADVATVTLASSALATSDELIQSFRKSVNKILWEAQISEMNKVQEIAQEINPLFEQSGLSREELGQKLTYMDEVEYTEGTVTSRKPAKTLLNPFKIEKFNLDRQDLLKVLGEAKKALRAGQAQGLPVDEINMLSEAAKLAQTTFDNWEEQHSHRQYSDAYYRELKQLKNDPIWVRADELSKDIWTEINDIQESIYNEDNPDEVERMENRIKELRVEYKQLSSRYDKYGALKQGEELVIADKLLEKARFNRTYYTYTLQVHRFNKTIKNFIDELDTVGENIQEEMRLLFTGLTDDESLNRVQLFNMNSYIDSLNNPVLSKWWNRQVSVKLNDTFYSTRTDILNQLNEINKNYDPTSFKTVDDITEEELESVYYLDPGENVPDGYKYYVTQPNIIKGKPYFFVRLTESNGLVDKKGISDKWEKITNAVKPYRDDVLDGALIEPVLQQWVRDVEKEIDDMKLKAVYNNADKNTVKELFSQLKSLQARVPTQSYITCILDMLDGVVLPAGLTIDEYSEFTSLINDDLFKQWLNNIDTTSNIQEQEFKVWYDRNHYSVTQEDGSIFNKRSYIWSEIQAKADNYYDINPNYQFNKRTIKDEHTTAKIEGQTVDFNGRWLPKINPQSVYHNQAYYELPDNLKVILDKLTHHYGEAQKKAYSGRLGYTVPFREKYVYEKNIVQAGRDALTNRYNRLEEEGIRQDTNSLIRNPFTYGRTQKFKTIPIFYTQFMPDNRVSDDLIGSIAAFAGNLEEYTVKAENVSFGLLTTRLLDQFQKNSNRFKYINHIVDSEFFQDRNDFELGFGVDRVVRVFKGIMTFSGQTVFNLPNNIKNFLSGVLQSSIQGHVDSSYMKAMFRIKFLFPHWLNAIRTGKLDKDLTIMKYLNPSMQNTFDKGMMGVKGDWKRRAISGDSFYITQQWGEFSISAAYTLAHTFRKKVKLDGRIVSLYDALESDNNQLSVRQGVTDMNNNPYTMDDLFNEKEELKLFSTFTQGVLSDQNYAQRYTTWKAVEFLRRYLIPAFQSRFRSQSVNIAYNDEIEGYWYTFWMQLVFPSFKSMLKHGRTKWGTLSERQKSNIANASKEYIILISLFVVLALLGFKDDDPEKFKKLKDNHIIINHIILQLILLRSEVESLTPLSPTLAFNDTHSFSPLISETSRTVEKSVLWLKTLKTSDKIVTHLIDYMADNPSGFYQKSMPDYHIKAGDPKFIKDLRSLIPYDNILYTYDNPEGKIRNYWQTLQR